MTNEELYNRITEALKEQGIRMNQLELKIKAETGKWAKLHTTRSRLRTGEEAMDLLDELLYSLKPSKEYLYKQRLKRKMQREAMR